MSGGAGHKGFPAAADPTRDGTITLPPHADYWYPCIELVDQGVTTGNAYLRYFVEGGVHFVQARTVAQKYWDKEGPVDQLVSTTAAPGGINLRVELLP